MCGIRKQQWEFGGRNFLLLALHEMQSSIVTMLAVSPHIFSASRRFEK